MLQPGRFYAVFISEFFHVVVLVHLLSEVTNYA